MIRAEEARNQSNLNGSKTELLYIETEISKAIQEGKKSVDISKKYMTKTVDSLIINLGYKTSNPYESHSRGQLVTISWRDD